MNLEQSFSRERKTDRIGEVNRNTNGELMRIIAYRNAMDIDIQFEDGAVVRNKSYGNFKNGHIRNYNSKCYDTTVKLDNIIGETVVNKAEQEMVCVGYRDYNDIDVKFPSYGRVISGVTYEAFKSGRLEIR